MTCLIAATTSLLGLAIADGEDAGVAPVAGDEISVGALVPFAEGVVKPEGAVVTVDEVAVVEMGVSGMVAVERNPARLQAGMETVSRSEREIASQRRELDRGASE